MLLTRRPPALRQVERRHPDPRRPCRGPRRHRRDDAASGDLPRATAFSCRAHPTWRRPCRQGPRSAVRRYRRSARLRRGRRADARSGPPRRRRPRGPPHAHGEDLSPPGVRGRGHAMGRCPLSCHVAGLARSRRTRSVDAAARDSTRAASRDLVRRRAPRHATSSAAARRVTRPRPPRAPRPARCRLVTPARVVHCARGRRAAPRRAR